MHEPDARHRRAALLSWLGLIFAGSQSLVGGMRQLASTRLATWVGHFVRMPFRTALAGIVAGAILQSTNAVTFLMAGLVGAEAMAVRDGLPLVAWCYTGSSLRLLLAVGDSRWLAWAALSGVAMLYQLRWDRASGQLSWRRGCLSGLLGMALLLLGIQTLSDACAPLASSNAAAALVAASGTVWGLTIAASAVLGTVLQGMTVSIMAILFTQLGILPIEQALLVVVGANVGSGVQSWIQPSALDRRERQLSVYQLLLKLAGAAVLTPWMAAEHYVSLFGPATLLRSMTSNPALLVTGMHWLFQIVAALVMSLANRPVGRLLEQVGRPIDAAALAQSSSKPGTNTKIGRLRSCAVAPAIPRWPRP